MASRRRVNPELMRAFEASQVEPFDFETPGRVIDVPLPPEHFGMAPEQPPVESSKPPKSRFDVVREYLESTRQPMPMPTTPDADIGAARQRDARQNQMAALQDASMAFLGRSKGAPADVHTAETQAMGERDARKRELEQWAAGRESQRTREAGLLSSALVEPSRKDPELERERFANDRRRMEEQERHNRALEEDRDADRDTKVTGRAAAAAAAAAKAEEKARLAAEKGAKKDTEGLAAGFDLDPSSNSTKKQREDHAGLVKASKTMKAMTKKMRGLLEGSDVVDRLNPLGKKRNDIKQLATMMQIEAKNVADLGALSGPDFALMQAIANDPTSLQSLTRDQTSVLDQLDSWSEGSAKAAAENIGARPKGANPSGTPDITPPKGKVAMVSEATGRTIFVTPETAAAGEKSKTLRKP